MTTEKNALNKENKGQSTPKNGTAPKTTPKKQPTVEVEQLKKELETAQRIAQEAGKQATAAMKEAEEARKFKPKDLNSILEKGAVLKALTDRLELLHLKKRELAAYKFGTDGTEDYVQIGSGKNAFRTSKTDVVKAVSELLKNKLEGYIKDTEAEIKEAAKYD